MIARMLGGLVGLLLSAGCGSGPAGRASGPISGLPVVRTWKDLLGQPAVDVGERVRVRFGIEREAGPVGSGVLIYCLAEGFSGWDVGHWNDRLGPLRVAVAEGSRTPVLLDAMPLQGLRGERDSVLLYVHALHFERPGDYRVALFTDEGRRIAEAAVRGTSDLFQPWLTWIGESELEKDHSVEGTLVRMIDASAVPAWRDLPVFRGRRKGLVARQDERLPTLMPESPDPGFRLRIEKDRGILDSDVDLWVLLPHDYLLVRWWVNGKAFVPSEDKGAYMMTHGGAYNVLRRLDLRLLLKPAAIGAKSGDRVDLQVLYCSDGWNWVTNDLEFRWPCGPGDHESPPLFRLSNRAFFLVP